MIRRRLAAAVLFSVVALASATAVGIGSSAASAASPIQASTFVPQAFSSMAVDPADHLVFASTPTNGSVVVFDFAGNVAATITGISPSTSVTYGSNCCPNSIVYAQGRIFVTSTANGTVDEINPQTLTLTGAIASGLNSPYYLVYTAGYLWTTSGGFWPPPTLERIDPSTGATTSFGGVSLEGAGLFADASVPNTVFSFDPTFSPLSVNRIDVSVTPTVTASALEDNPVAISNVLDIAVSPDGQHFVPAGGAPYQFDEFNTSNLANDGLDYPANPYPTAVAMTGARSGLFAGGMNGFANPDLVVYGLDRPADQILSYQFGANSEVLPRGLAFSPDGTTLFAVSSTSGTSGFDFNVLALGGSSTSTTLSASPTTTTYGSPVTLTASVASSDGSGNVQFFANGTALPGCAAVALNASDAAACTTTGLAGGTDSVTADYSGDGASFASGSAPVVITVNPAPTSLKAQPAVVAGKHPSVLTLSATLLTASNPVAGQLITMMAGKVLVCSAVTNASGVASCNGASQVLAVLANKGYTATFAGNSDYQPSSSKGGIVRG